MALLWILNGNDEWKKEYNMKRILTGFIMDGKSGGIDKYLLNFLEATKGKDVRIDFLTNEVDGELKEKLCGFESRLFAIANLRHPIKQYLQVCAILQKEKYDTVYLNISTAIDCVTALAAMHMKVPKRIIHSHSSGNDCESKAQRVSYNILHYICRLFLYRTATDYYGCSKKAGMWLFPKKIVNSKKFQVIFNTVDRTVFVYDEALRKKTRKEMGIESKLVIGHVGNFCYAKNYPFLVQVFEQVLRQQKNAILLLVGSGIELEEIKEQVRKRKMEHAVRFLGWCADTNKLYQAMDIFLLPSRFEGLPIVGVEAQCTKLECIFSNHITSEAKIQERCYFLPYKASPQQWAQFIMEHQRYDRKEVKLLEEACDYDLVKQSKQWERIYGNSKCDYTNL